MMNKIIPLLAFSILLLVQVGAQNAFALDTTSTIGDFQCWDIQNVDVFFPSAVMDLTDQFGTQRDVQLGLGFPLQTFCAYAGVSGIFPGPVTISSPLPDLLQQHLNCYPIDGPEAQKEVELTDMFGETTQHIVGKPVELCVPGQKVVAQDPFIFPQLTDIHYKCYEITQSPQNFPRTISAFDQFFTTSSSLQVLDLADKLCVPVEKTVTELGGNTIQNPITVGNKDFADHLKCHKYDGLSTGPIFFDLRWTDQFSNNLLYNHPSGPPQSLCLVVSKVVIDDSGSQVIGGEIIPIEVTSLIIAGANSFSWVLPVILSILGIGLFVVSRKNQG